MKFPDEKSIFDFLNMEYKEPEERIDGNSVVESITATEKSPEQPDDSGTFKVSPEAIEQTDVAPVSTTALSETVPTEQTSKSFIIKVKKSKKKKAKTVKKPPTTTAKQNLKTFQKQGETFLQSLTEKELENMVETATKAYYNEKPLITDNQFDIVKEFTEREYPTNKVITQVGAPIEKNKVTLPYFMGSMDKIKPDTKALSRWMDKFSGPYVLSGKLDGISALYTTDEDEPHLYTRGNGRVGQDITYMIPYLKLPEQEGLVIRGELIVSKEVFQTKYADSKANARNLVAGIVNAKKVDESAYNDVSFVAYELIKPEMKPSEQFSTLESYNVETVRNQSEETLTNDMLSKTLVDWRESYEYETDGVIVTDMMQKLGFDQPDYDADQVLAEIADIVPFFKGITRERLGKLGLQWPVKEDGTDTQILHTEEFKLGRGRLKNFDWKESTEIETNKKEYPLILTTSRVLQHYNAATMTRRTSNINIVDEDVLLVHPKDAADRDLNTGDIGRLYSGRGEVALKVEVTDKVKEGIVFTTFHFPEHMVNMVTGHGKDEETMCAEYKVSSVQVQKISNQFKTEIQPKENQAEVS